MKVFYKKYMETKSVLHTSIGVNLKGYGHKNQLYRILKPKLFSSFLIPIFMDCTNHNKVGDIMKSGLFKKLLLALFIPIIFVNFAFAQTVGDYQTAGSGNWNVNATWERFNGVGWVAAGATPTNADGIITIRASHTVTVSAAVTADQIIVNGNGTITIAAAQILTLNNGAGTDLVISATGTVNIGGTLTGAGSVDLSGVLVNSGTYSATGALNVLGGGRYQHNINGGTIPTATWNATSICEVTGVTNTAPVAASINQNFGDFIWNCPAQLANITVILANAIQGDLTITNTSGSDFILNNSITLNNSSNLTVGANGIFTTGNDIIFTGTGSVTIDGTFRTNDATGLYGLATTSIVGTPNIYLNVGSTIDYSLNGAQNITASATFLPAATNYSNLATSNGGIKTLLGVTNVNANLTIGAGTTIEVNSRTLTVSGTTSILGTLADNNALGIANLQNVTIQGGTINHTTTAAVNIAGSLTATGGSSTIGTANITVTGATTINAGATLNNSGAGNKYYNGGITIAATGTWSATGAPNIRIQNGLTNNGTMSSTGGGTYTFNNTQSISGSQAITFQGPVLIPATFTVTNNNTSGVTFQGTLTGGAATAIFVNNTNMYYANNSTPMAGGTLTATAVGNTVYYSLAGDQPIRTTTYNNLSTSGSGIKTAGGALTVQGNLNIASNTTLADAGNVVSVNGNVTNNGTATTVGVAGGITITGGAPPHTITGNGSYQRLTINSNTTMVTTVASFSVNDLILNGANSLTINNNTLTINNSFAGANLIGGATSSLVLNGTIAIPVPASLTILNNFTLNNTGGSSLSGPLDIRGTPTLTNGAFTFNGAVNTLTIRNTPVVTTGYFNTNNTSTLLTAGGNIINIPAAATPNVLNLTKNSTNTLTFNGSYLNNVNIAAAGNFILGADVGVTGNWANPSGTLNANGRTVTFNGGGAQAISGANNYFYTVDISKTGGTLTLTNDIYVSKDWLYNLGGFDPNTNLRAVIFNGAGSQSIGGLLSTTFYNLTVDNANGPVSLSNSQSVNNLLTLQSVGSKLYLGGSNLTMNGTAIAIAGVGASNYIVSDGPGKLIKTFAGGATTYTFPLGDVIGAAEYSPVSITLSAASNGSSLGMRVVNDKDPNYNGTTDYLNRYWVATNEFGFAPARNIDYVFTLGATDKIGNQANIYGAYYTGGAWTKNAAAIGAAATFSVNGVSTNLLTADFSGIDNDPPSVVSITPNTGTVTDAFVGPNGFSLTIVYDENMDPAAIPSVTFPTAGENPSPTLTFSSGTWVNAFTYVAYFNVADNNLVMNNIDVSVSNGRDLSGNIQSPNPQVMAVGNGLNAFNIAMTGPVVLTAVPNTVLITDATPAFFITITFNTPMDQTLIRRPVVSFPTAGENPNLDNTLGYDIAGSSWTDATHFVARFTLADHGLCMNNIDIRIAGAQDLVGNVQAIFTPPTVAAMNMFSISMANPVEAGNPQEVCGTVNLNATPSPFATRYWTCNQPGVVYSNSTSPTATVTNLAIGSNIFTWTVIYNGCTSTDQVTITNNQVTVAAAGPDQTFCTNTTALAANTPASGTGAWSIISGSVTFANNLLPGTVITNIAVRDNILQWTITRGICSSWDQVRISNYSVDSDAGIDGYTCDGTYQLDGRNPATQNITIPNIPATGTWTTPGPAIIANINLYNTNVTNLNRDANTFRWTITNGVCTDFDEVVISNDMPTLPNAGPDANFCGIDFAPNGYNSIYNSLTANGPDYARNGIGETGVWTQVAGTSTFLDANTTLNLRVDNLALYAQLAGPAYWNLNPSVNTYRWTITYKLCSLYDEVVITNSAPDSAHAGPDQTVCWDNADLDATDLGNYSQLHWWIATPPAGIIFYDPLTSAVTAPFLMPFNSHVEGLQIGTTTFRWYKQNTITDGALNTKTCTIWDETDVTRVASNLGATSAGPDQVLCSRDALMQGSPPNEAFVSPPVYNVTGQWSVISGGGTFANANSYSTLVTNLNYDVNIMRWTLTNHDLANCIITNDVYIVNALPSNPNAGPDQMVCTPDALLSAERPTRGTGVWTVLGGTGVITDPTCINFNCDVYVNGMGTGKNTFLWTITNTYTHYNGLTRSCVLADTLEVWNNALTAEAGIAITTCNDTAILASNAPGVGQSGTWWVTGGSGIVSTPSAYNSMVTNLSPNLNTLRWTLNNGLCNDADFITITNNNPTDPVVSTPTPFTCDSTATITANNPLNGTGVWSVKAGGGIITNPLASATSVTHMPGGLSTYTWTITKVGCSESADVVVDNRAVKADAGADIDDVCGIEPRIDTAQLNAVAPNLALGQTGNWSIITSTGSITTPSLFNTTITGMDNGTNTFVWRLSNGSCSDTSHVNVFVYIPTTADAGADYETCADLPDSWPLTGNPPGPGRGTGSWVLVSGGGNIANSLNAVTSVSNLAPDENVFRWSINYNGCISRDEVIITNNYVYADAGPNDSICSFNYTLAGNDPVANFYNGLANPTGQWTLIQGTAAFTAPTLYNTNVSNLSTAVANIYRWTITKGICSDFDEVSIVNSSFTISAGADQTVCNDYAFLSAQAPGTGTGVWNVISGGGTFVNPAIFNTRVNGLSTNPNIYRWTVTRNGCSASDDVIVYKNQVTALAGNDDNVCLNTAILDGNDPSLLMPPGATGNWIATVGGASITTPALRNTGVTNLASGQNTFQWTISRTLNGVTCSNSDLVNIFNDMPSNAVVEPDNAVCTNSTQLTVLNPPTIGTGQWSALDNVATFDNINSTNPTVTGLNLGINTFRWTVIYNACSSTDDVVITNNSVIATAGIDKSTVCADFTTLSGNNPILTQGTGLWTDLSGSGATIVSPTLYNTSVTGLQQGNTDFRWTVSLGLCSNSDIVTITNNQITATAGIDQITCNDFYGPLDGNDVSGLGGTGVWTSIGNTAVVTNSTLFNTGVTGLDPGLNTFRWTVTSGAESCIDFAEVGITNSKVIANAGSDFETCNGTITLGAQNPAPANGVWTPASGNPVVIVTPNSPTSQVNGLTGGIYAFTWTVSNVSCSNSDNVIITNSLPQPAIAGTGGPIVCNGNGFLVGNVPLVGETGLWTGGGVSIIATPSNNNSSVSNMPLGPNTYTWTLTKGTNVTCTSSNSVIITNNQVVSNAGSDKTTVCNDFVTLSGNNPALTQGSGLWTDQSVTTATFADNTLYNTLVNTIRMGSTTFRWTVSLGTCSASDDVIITNNQIVASAGTDQTTCFSYYDPLDGNDVSGSGGTGLWTTTGSGTFVLSTLYNTRVNNLQSGLNTLTWTVTSASEGCSDSDDVVITYVGVTADAGIDLETCNASINLSAIAPAVGTGSWTQTGGAAVTITNSTDRQTSITGLSGGIFSFTWTVVNGTCSTSDVVNVTNSTPTASNPTTPAAIVCNGNAILLGNAPIAGETGLWTGGGVSIIATPSNNNTTVSNMPLGLNTYTWTLTKGTNVTCTSSNSVIITNNQVVSNAGSDKTTVCNDFVTLSGNNPALTQGSGLWTDQSVTTATFVNNILYNTLVNNIRVGTTTFRWTVSLGICSASDDVIITNNQIVANAGADQNSCNSYYDPLDGNDVSSVSGTGKWTAPGTITFVNSSLYNTRVNNLQSGLNTLTWTVTSASEGCTDNDDVVINNIGVTADAGLDIETCNATVNLSAVAPSSGIGSWTQTGGAAVTITNSLDRQSSITGLTGGTFSFTWTVLNGACNASDVVVVTNSSPSISNPNTPLAEVCNGNAVLQGNAPALGESGLWTGGGSSTIATPSNNITTVSGMPMGLNTFTWTLSKGTNVTCTSSNSVNITNSQVVSNAGADKTTACNDFVTLSGNNPLLTQGTGQWTDQSATTATFANNALYNTLVNTIRIGTTTFRWTVSQGGCSISDDVIITNNQITASAGADQPTCNSYFDPLDGNDVSGISGTGIWTTTGSGTFVNSTQYNTRVNNLQSGLNTLTWTVTSASEGCTDSDDIIVAYNGVTANAGSDIETCNASINLSAIAPAVGTGSWTQTGGAAVTITNSTDRQTSITGMPGGVFSFTWTVVNGICSTSDVVVITNSTPTVSNPSTPATEVCNGNAVLQANAPVLGERGLWTGGGTSIIATPSNNNTTVSNMPLGVNTYTWTITKGTNVSCTSSNSVSITNNKVVSHAGADKTTSCNDFATLAGNNPTLTQGSGLWTDQSATTAAFVDNTLYNTLVNTVRIGITTFRWTVSQGICSISDDVLITNNQITASAGVDQPTCSSYFDPLDGNDVSGISGTGIWTTTGSGTFVNSTQYNTRVNNLQSGLNTLTWTVTSASEGCTDSDDIILAYNGVTAYAGSDIETCNASINLSAIAPAVGTGSWTQTGGAAVTITNSTDRQTSITGMVGGVFSFTWTIVNGICSNSDVVVITNSTPAVSNPSTPATEVCNGNAVLQANPLLLGERGLWTGGGTSIIASPSNNNTTLSSMPLGLNTYTWTITKGTNVSCSSSNSVSITNNKVVANAGLDNITACTNFITLLGNDPTLTQGSGLWSDQTVTTATFVNNTLYNTLVNNVSKGITTFRWTVSLGICSASDDVLITNNLTDIANAGIDTTICNNVINLYGNDPIVGTGTWTSSTSAIITTPSLYNTSVTVPTGPTVFTWTITNNGLCPSSDNIVVRNNSLTVNVNNDVTVCNGTYNLLGTNPALIGTGTGTGQWTLIGGSGIVTNTAAFSTTVTGLERTGSRESAFRWTIVDGLCSASDDIKITNDQVTADGTGFMTCSSSASILANDPGLEGATGIWTFDNPQGQVIANSTSYTTTVSNLRPNAINRLSWTVTRNTCSATDTVNIEYFVPNANIIIPNINPPSCADTIQLIADPNLGGGSGVWSLKFGSLQVLIDNSTSPTTIARDLEIGNNVFVWTVTNRGCTSFDEVIIDNSLPVNTAGSNQTACNNTFTMNAQAPSATGSGQWTLISGTVTIHTPSLATTVVTAAPGTNILRWTITDMGCSSSKDFRITNNLTSPNAGTDVTICQNNIKLSGSPLNPGESGLWTILGGTGFEVFSNSSVNNPDVTNLSPGVYFFRWTVTNGNCPVSDDVRVENNTPVVNAGKDSTICSNQITLYGNNLPPGTTGLWTIGSGSVHITTPTAYNTHVTNLSQGSNLFTWTVDNGKCIAQDFVLITSNSINVSAGLSTFACADTLILTATQPPVGATGAWTAVQGSGTFDNATSYNTIARNLLGFNKLRWTITTLTSCSFYGELDFTSQLPTISATEVDKAVCSNSTQITGNPPDVLAGESGAWTVVIGPPTINFANSASFQTMVTGLGIGTNVFKWTIRNSNCPSSDLLTITNNEVTANAGNPQNGLCDSVTTLSANVPTGITGVWTANTLGVIIANSTNANTGVSNLRFGTNSFSWTINYNGCIATDEVIVTSNLPRNVSAGPDNAICTGTYNLAGSNPGIGSGIWTVTGGNGVFANNTANQTLVSNLSRGSNRFQWTVTVGSCSVSDEVTIDNNSIYVDAGTNKSDLCDTNQWQLNGTAPGPGITGIWTLNGGAGTFVNPTLYNTIVSDPAKGINSYKWTLTDGACPTSAFVTVENITPDSAKVGAPQFICADSTTINATPVSNGVGSWSQSGSGGTIINPLSNNTIVRGINLGLTTFTWTVNKNGCKLSADLNVTIHLFMQIYPPILILYVPLHIRQILLQMLLELVKLVHGQKYRQVLELLPRLQVTLLLLLV
jgi:hypothetical protein